MIREIDQGGLRVKGGGQGGGGSSQFSKIQKKLRGLDSRRRQKPFKHDEFRVGSRIMPMCAVHLEDLVILNLCNL
jgi:hypothetical protein